MLVTLTPGVDRMRVLELLQQAALLISNNHGKPSEYARWTIDTARTLRGQISRSDLEQLFFTPTFHQLLAGHGVGTMVGQSLLEAEIYERKELFLAVASTLEKQIKSWSVAPETVLAVVDSSVFLSHPSWIRDEEPANVIASIPWAEELGVGFSDVLLILPEVVIRELDRLKESSNKTLRYRALVTLAVIDKLLRNPYGTVTIRDTMPYGMVQMKVFYDDPAHRPLADSDAEIIDRTLAVQTLAGKPVRLVSMDTGMALNARRAQLEVTKPPREIEEPAAEGQSTRARRRERDAAANGDQRTQVTG